MEFFTNFGTEIFKHVSPVDPIEKELYEGPLSHFRQKMQFWPFSHALKCFGFRKK